jgi:hypothetical protein
MADYRSPLEKLQNVVLSDFEQRLRACQSSDEIRDFMAQQQNGTTATVTRKYDGSVEYSYGQPGGSVAPQSAPKVADDGMLRSVWMLPDGKIHVCEASSPSGIDALERSLQTWKGARKLSGV